MILLHYYSQLINNNYLAIITVVPGWILFYKQGTEHWPDKNLLLHRVSSRSRVLYITSSTRPASNFRILGISLVLTYKRKINH